MTNEAWINIAFKLVGGYQKIELVLDNYQWWMVEIVMSSNKFSECDKGILLIFTIDSIDLECMMRPFKYTILIKE